MSLLDIKQHMIKVRVASLGSLCAVFRQDADTMRCLLNHFLKKGCLRQCSKKPACGSQCFKCPVSATEMYEWVETTAIMTI